MLHKLLRQQCSWQFLLGAIFMTLSGCATELPLIVVEPEVSGKLADGRVVTTITGESQRVYPPELRSFEVINTESEQRLKVYVKSEGEYFDVSLLPAH